MEQEIGRAVGGQRVVERRMGRGLVDALDVVQEQAPGLPPWQAQAIEIYFLLRLPIGGAQANHIAFVGNDVHELILLEKPLDGRVLLGPLFTGLNRNSHVILLPKAKTEKQVGDGVTAPVRTEQVNRIQALQVKRLIIVPWSEIRGAAVF